MNRSVVVLGVLGMAVGLVACGGDDSVNIPAADGGTDSLVTQDTSVTDTGNPPPPDSSVTDTGTTTDSSVADSGSDTGVTPDASSFNVGAVSGLALWLDAAKGVTQNAGKVSAWADQSGNANNAAQSNQNNRPGFTASAINSLPGVHFDGTVQAGTFMTIVDAATLNWTTGDYFLAAVVRYTNDPTSGFGTARGTLYFKEGFNPSAGPALYANAFNGATTTSGFATQMSANNAADRLVSIGTGYNDNKGHLFVVHRGGTTLDLRHNGAADGTKVVTAVDVSAPTIDVSIGASGGGNGATNRLSGDIAEMIAVKGAISGGDLTGIEGYLKAKYALP